MWGHHRSTWPGKKMSPLEGTREQCLPAGPALRPAPAGCHSLTPLCSPNRPQPPLPWAPTSPSYSQGLPFTRAASCQLPTLLSPGHASVNSLLFIPALLSWVTLTQSLITSLHLGVFLPCQGHDGFHQSTRMQCPPVGAPKSWEERQTLLLLSLPCSFPNALSKPPRPPRFLPAG